MSESQFPSCFLRRPATLAIIGAAALIVVGGLYMRWSHAGVLQERAATRHLPTVALVAPSPVSTPTMTLPARIEAWARAPIHARVNGYLKHWAVDIGSHVKSGQTLAEIETPDLDQQLQQARAELARARSEAALADTTARRWQSLLDTDSVSRQEVEERTANAQARQADVHALQANVERIQALQQFRRITAPFDGIVTARNTDVGALINAGMNQGSELFVVSDTHRLRVYVDVPQRQLTAIRAGSQATLSVPEHPGRRFAATVQSLSQAIDADSGSMRVQLMVDNPKGELLPGGFATVHFEQTEQAQMLGLPPSALILGRNGVQVAVLGGDDRAQLRPVSIVRDFGSVVQLAAGDINATDRIISNPPDGIASGDAVRVATQEPNT